MEKINEVNEENKGKQTLQTSLPPERDFVQENIQIDLILLNIGRNSN
jgi:hypothetical protein